MRETVKMGEMGERRSSGDGMKKMGTALHDLCQPLTTLQCRLEIAKMTDTPEDYREAVVLGLLECARLVEAVGSMRGIVRAAVRECEIGEPGVVR